MALAETFQSSQLLGNLGVKHAFLPAGAGLPPDLIRCHQVHSANVLLVGNSRDFTRENADGLITEDRNPIGIAIARAQLKSCGVPKNQIECIELCTYCGPEIFDSYRRNTHEMKANSSQ